LIDIKKFNSDLSLKEKKNKQEKMNKKTPKKNIICAGG